MLRSELPLGLSAAPPGRLRGCAAGQLLGLQLGPCWAAYWSKDPGSGTGESSQTLQHDLSRVLPLSEVCLIRYNHLKRLGGCLFFKRCHVERVLNI